MTSRYVVDSYAWIVFLQREPGWKIVQELFREAEADGTSLYMSLVNFGELIYIIERRRGLPAVDRFLATAHAAPIEFIVATYQRTIEAAHIKANHPLSYADAFTTALAQEISATVLTGDPEFQAVAHKVPIQWL